MFLSFFRRRRRHRLLLPQMELNLCYVLLLISLYTAEEEKIRTRSCTHKFHWVRIYAAEVTVAAMATASETKSNEMK